MKTLSTCVRLLLPLVLLHLAAARCAGAQTPVYDIPRLDGITIDGDAGDWGDRGMRIDVIIPSGAYESKRSNDFSASARLGWNDQGLLVLVNWRDDVWLEAPRVEGASDYDSILIFVARQAGPSDFWRLVVSPGVAPGKTHLAALATDVRKNFELRKTPVPFQVARKVTDGVCVVEALIDWSAVPIKPEVGQTLAFNVAFNDVDAEGDDYYPMWPADPGASSLGLHAIRLSTKASNLPELYARTWLDTARLQTCVEVTGIRGLAGRKTGLHDGAGKALAAGKMEIDGEISRAVFRLPLAPPGHAPGKLRVDVRGEHPVTLDAPDAAALRGNTLAWLTPKATPGTVFAGETLPRFELEDSYRLSALIGPCRIQAKYYDSAFESVTRAEKPGRYGTVIEIRTADGKAYKRFITLFRTAGEFRGRQYAEKIYFPEEFGLKKDALSVHAGEVEAFVRRSVEAGFSNPDMDSGAFLAGLSESSAGDTKDDFYSTVLLRDRQWWVTFKRKLYGYDAKYPSAFVAPKAFDGPAAMTVHEGTLVEAGMRPDAATKIDDVCTRWAADSDQAFAVCIVRHGVIVIHKAYGIRDGKAMTVKTKSWMASITKLLGATSLMMLADQGLVDLDAPVGRYIAPLEGLATNRPLTVRRLYNHTAGFHDHIGCSMNDLEERVTALAPCLEVGKRYEYNGTSLELGARIIENVSGESLPAFYRKHLLGPLGCDDTDVSDACAGASSVPLDMARFGQMLLNKGAYGNVRFMSQESFRRMLPVDVAPSVEEPTDAKTGVAVQAYPVTGFGEDVFGHGAASNSVFFVSPAKDMVVVVTRNAAGANYAKHYQEFLAAVAEGISEPAGGK